MAKKPQSDRQILSSLKRIEAHTSVLPTLLRSGVFRRDQETPPSRQSEIARAVVQDVERAQGARQRRRKSRQERETVTATVQVEQAGQGRDTNINHRNNVDDESTTERRTDDSSHQRRRQADRPQEERQAKRRTEERPARRERVRNSPRNEDAPPEGRTRRRGRDQEQGERGRRERAPASENAQNRARQARRDRQEEQRQNWLLSGFKKLVDWVRPGERQSNGNSDAEDTAGLAAGGSFWEAAKELHGLSESLSETMSDSKLGEFFNRSVGKFFGRDSREQLRDDDGRIMSVRDSQRERGRAYRAEVLGNIKSKIGGLLGIEQEQGPSPGTRNTDDEQEQRESDQARRDQARESAADDRTEAITDQLQDQRRESEDQREEITGAVRAGNRSRDSRSGGPSIDDFLPGDDGDDNSPSRRRRRRGRAGGQRGRPPVPPTPPPGRFNKVLQGGRSLLGRAGAAVTTISSKAALPLAGALAGFSKYSELKDDESLTDGQKGVQVASTATGAMGGSLAGAAAGAAIGSVLPFVGTAIGGLIGAVIGGMGGEKLGTMIGEGITGRMSGPEANLMLAPERIEPEGTVPEPATPANIEPEPATPANIEPEPATPAKIEPEPATPANIEPEPATPANIEPEPATPAKIEPEPATPAKIEPEPATPAKIEPEPATPAKIEPEPATPAKIAAEQAMTAPVEKPAPMKATGPTPGKITGSAPATGSVTVNVDEKKLASAINSAIKNPGKQSQPKVASKDIPTEFDDGLLTLMAYDRI